MSETTTKDGAAKRPRTIRTVQITEDEVAALRYRVLLPAYLFALAALVCILYARLELSEWIE